MLLFTGTQAFAASRPAAPSLAAGADIRTLVEEIQAQAGVSGAVLQAASPIRFDKPVYSWTDKVVISIFAPAWNSNPNRIDTIGAQRSHQLKVATRKHSLVPYKLVETSPNSGRFTGEIILTGFAHDANGDGRPDTQPRTSGNGPTNGYLENKGNDAVTVSWRWSSDQTMVRSVPIKMNDAALLFDADSYSGGETATVRLTEPDMNINPQAVDRVRIHVYSDTDRAGSLIDALETDDASGIFEAQFSLTKTGTSSAGRIRAEAGDNLYADYLDRTLPPPAGSRETRRVRGVAGVR